MEKLIVKNFGPIKEAEIDLTKYVVFIGDTSTGKSVLAKLIAIFRYSHYVFTKNDGAKSKFDLVSQLKYYNIDFEFFTTEITYEFNEIKIILKGEAISYFSFDKEINLKFNLSDAELNYQFFTNAVEISNTSTFIPPDRLLVSIVGESVSGLWANNVALPAYFKTFAGRYEVAKKEIKSSNYTNFGFDFKYENGESVIIGANSKILLSQASSGIQSLLPLLLVIDYELLLHGLNIIKTILIEEPELNLFPSKQKKLIEQIVQKFYHRHDNLIITTHSPYILSVLDTLMLAKNTYNEHPDLKEEIAAIVSEDKWIDYNDISVYEVRNDGTIKSIKNEEFKSIDTNAIDGVSDIISEQFDKLTELRYAQ